MKNTRKMVSIGIMAAVAMVLQFIEVSIPIIPSFIKLDFSDIPELIIAFAYGPLSGCIVCLIKNLIHMPLSSSAFIGELSNFLLGCCFVVPAGLIYKKNKTKKTALIASIAGAVIMGLCSLPLNYFLIYPLYMNVLGFPYEAIVGMYQAILPSADTLVKDLIIFNIPFTICKGLIDAAITFLIYKRISPILKGIDNKAAKQ
ncbi:MAG: ECF transporter S component [Clostridia bacterium]|nr:ECF transporter S component [Clostridia bacterium]MBR5991582.1 ECF transporter S component [Clostridia bacterium]